MPRLVTHAYRMLRIIPRCNLAVAVRPRQVREQAALRPDFAHYK